MKKIRRGLAAIAVAGVFLYTFNVQYFAYFLSLVCNSAIECVSGGNEYSTELAKELNTLSVSKFIRLTVNGKDIDLDNTDFGQDFYDDIVGAQETAEEESEQNVVSWKRNLQSVDELDISQFYNLKYNGIVKVNTSGSNRPLMGEPNSYYSTGNGEHVFVYDENGKLIYDISKLRVKSFKINVDPRGGEHYKAYKLIGKVPQEIKDIFGW